MQISSSDQTCALGSAVVAAVVAGAHKNYAEGIKAMVAAPARTYTPTKEGTAVYEKLYRLYRQVHDAFGVAGTNGSISNVMKDLLTIRDQARGH